MHGVDVNKLLADLNRAAQAQNAAKNRPPAEN